MASAEHPVRMQRSCWVAAHGSSWHECEVQQCPRNGRFSNRPFWVKRFQAIHHSSVDVAHGLALLFGLGTKGPSIMGFEDEVEQSFGRPCRQCDCRFNGGLILLPGPVGANNRDLIIALGARHQLPAVYHVRAITLSPPAVLHLLRGRFC